MSPRDCPRCRSTDGWDFSDQISATMSRCLCGQRKAPVSERLFGALVEAGRQADESIRLEQEREAERVHAYRLQVDPAYRARIESELQRLVQQQQDAERAAEQQRIDSFIRAEKEKKAKAASDAKGGLALLVLFGLFLIGMGVLKIADYLL